VQDPQTQIISGIPSHHWVVARRPTSIDGPRLPGMVTRSGPMGKRGEAAIAALSRSLPGRGVLAPGVQPKVGAVAVLTRTRAPDGNEYAEGFVAVDCDRHGLLAGRTHVRVRLTLPFDHFFTVCPYWRAGKGPAP
jgi:hypothetical protein